MKACIIAPIPELDEFGYGEIHLLLSHLMTDPRYASHYRQEKQKNKSYLILDNSAHEFSSGQPAETLIEQAREVNADEVVAPDVLFDADQTIERCREALEFWSSSKTFADLHPNVMLVPQGDCYASWRRCLYALMTEYDHVYRRCRKIFKQVPVIGVSKDYEVWPGGLAELFERDLVIIMEQEWVNVHLLGWGRDLWKLGRIARTFGSIRFLRSVDSAKPIVYAMSGIRLDPSKSSPEYPKRSPDFFDQTLTPDQRSIAFDNVNVFDRLAHGWQP